MREVSARKRLVAIAVGSVLIALGLGQTISNAVSAASSKGFRDFERHWSVFQYIRAGQNPYAIALSVLHHAEDNGWTPPPVLADARSIPGWKEVDGVRADLGPPETNYPPSVIVFLAYTVGLLPAERAALGWTIVNLLLLAFLAVRLLRQAIPSATDAVLPAATLAAGIILVWPPTQAVLYSNQVTFLVMCCVLLALDAVETDGGLAGFWFALALYKPSVSLLFLIYPVVRGRFRVIATAGMIHLTSLLLLGDLVGAAPWQLVAKWLEHAHYYVWKMYSVREILGGFGPAVARFEGVAQAALVASIFLLCWYHRATDKERIVDFLCFATFTWVGHGNYDFVFLLVPAMHSLRRLFVGNEYPGDRRSAALQLLGLALVGAGLTYHVYYMKAEWEHLNPTFGWLARLARWVCRLSLAAMFVAQAIRLRRSHSASGSRVDCSQPA